MMKSEMIGIAAIACVAALITGCSGGTRADSAQSSAPQAAAQNSEPTAAPGEAASAPNASASPATAANGACPLIGGDQVEQVMRLTVRSVDVTNDSNGCTFHFQGGDHGDLQVAYAAQGGREQLDSVRKAGAGTRAIFGGIAKAASAPAGAMGMVSATPPADVAKVGDDQYFMTEGPVTQFYATKGDAYVEVDGGFLPEGISRWIVFPEIAKRILATR